MRLSDIIARVDEARPNQFDKDIKTNWINELEAKVHRTVLRNTLWGSDGYEPYVYDRDSERTLAIPDEHCDCYETYLYAKMDYTNGEIDRYNADAAMHQAAWQDFAADYRRRFYPRPIQ